MKTLKNNFEILSVNGLTGLSLVLAWVTHFINVLTVLVLITSVIYNCMKIYDWLKKKMKGVK